MRAHHVRRTAAVVALVCSVAGCAGSPGGSGKEKEEKETGTTYKQAMDAMYPDALSAMKATMPGIEPEESSGGSYECGGWDFIDSKDASKLKAVADIRIPGDPTDTRQSDALVDAAVNHLTKKGWKIDTREDAHPPAESEEVIKYLQKPGASGFISVSAAPFKLTSGKISQTLTTQVITDCLRNPDWKK